MGIKQAFDQGASDYDHARKQLIPCFNDFYGCALDIIPFANNSQLNILDLGAGTGLLAQLISERFYNAQFTLCDISSGMLAEAKKRFSGTKIKVDYLIKDYAIDKIKGEYDLIVSALSIHHLTDLEKQLLFKKLHLNLKSNGLFINADQVLGDSKCIEQTYRDNWLKKVKENGVTDYALSSALQRMREDKMSPLKIQLSWLREAGFKEVNCWYKNYSFVVYSGQKN